MVDCPPLTVVDETMKMLLRNGMYDLAQIDYGGGPTDLIHHIMQEPGIYEQVITLMIGERPGFAVLPTEWFHYYQLSSKEEDIYSSQVSLYREMYLFNQPPNTTLLALYGVDMDSLGGHYAAFYITADKVEIHDSMTTFEGPGAYSPFFLQLAKDLFGGREVKLSTVGAGEIGLQPTGGFLWFLPSFMRGLPLQDPVATQLLQSSNVESQDHFCWGWALFYLHSRILGVPLSGLRKELQRTAFPQVALIKVYVWLLISWMRMDHKLPSNARPDYFGIWDAVNRLDPEDYRRYQISLADPTITITAIDQCFDLVYDLSNIKLTRLPYRTEPPIGCLL